MHGGNHVSPMSPFFSWSILGTYSALPPGQARLRARPLAAPQQSSFHDRRLRQLPDEQVDAWRPAEAVPVGAGLYRILDQPYDREIERWEFEPGMSSFASSWRLM